MKTTALLLESSLLLLALLASNILPAATGASTIKIGDNDHEGRNLQQLQVEQTAAVVDAVAAIVPSSIADSNTTSTTAADSQARTSGVHQLRTTAAAATTTSNTSSAIDEQVIDAVFVKKNDTAPPAADATTIPVGTSTRTMQAGQDGMRLVSAKGFNWSTTDRLWWKDNCDWVGKKSRDIRNITGRAANQCGRACFNKSSDCDHFTWSNFKGGTCWLKRYESRTREAPWLVLGFKQAVSSNTVQPVAVPHSSNTVQPVAALPAAATVTASVQPKSVVLEPVGVAAVISSDAVQQPSAVVSATEGRASVVLITPDDREILLTSVFVDSGANLLLVTEAFCKEICLYFRKFDQHFVWSPKAADGYTRLIAGIPITAAVSGSSECGVAARDMDERVVETELAVAGNFRGSAFVDDLLLWDDTFEEHLQQIDQLLKHFIKVDLMVHPAKTVVAAETMGYLGHLVLATHCRPEEAKVAAIRALQPPTTVKCLQAHLGLLGY
eukprot:gene9601-biopygen11499